MFVNIQTCVVNIPDEGSENQIPKWRNAQIEKTKAEQNKHTRELLAHPVQWRAKREMRRQAEQHIRESQVNDAVERASTLPGAQSSRAANL